MKRSLFLFCICLAHLMSISQPAVNLTGKQCLSGNCVNGKGRLRLPQMDNREYEGGFTNSLLTGEGRAYARSAGGRLYLEWEGLFTNGALVFGKIYDESGRELMNGTFSYDGDKRKLIGGSRLITCRGKPATLFCMDMTTNSETGLISYTGLVDVYEGTNGRAGRQLSQANYLFGNRHGLAYEWDYDNNVLHYLKYNDGKRLDSTVIKTLTGDTVIASLVRYVASESDEFFLNIERGMFRFGKHNRYYLISNTSRGTLAYFKQEYDTYNPFDYSIINGQPVRKTAEQVNAMLNRFPPANSQSQGSSNNSIDTRDLSPMQLKFPGNKYWDQVASDGVSALTLLNEKMQRFYSDAERLVKYTIQRSYYTNKKRLDDMREKILKEIDWKVQEWTEKVPNRLIYAITDARRRIKTNYQMPGPGAFPRKLN
ncbi:MAG: hypothetical protein IPI66_10355 [Chitinophagaceae bacterium]|nr:hypothetical protein [Chitinophagaceae bacterium]